MTDNRASAGSTQAPLTSSTLEHGSRRGIFGLLALPLLAVLNLAAALLYRLFTGHLPGTLAPNLLLVIVAELLFITLALNLCWRREEWRQALFWHRPTTKGLTTGVVSGLGLFLFIAVATALLKQAGLPLESSDTTKEIAAAKGPLGLLATYFIAPFLAPLCEELVFRGVALAATDAFLRQRYKTLSPRRSALLAALSTSVLFALAHSQGYHTLNDYLVPCWVFLGALLYSSLLVKFRSIAVPIAAHMTYNLAIVAIMALAALGK